MQCALSCSPLCFSLSSSIILLCRESSLPSQKTIRHRHIFGQYLITLRLIERVYPILSNIIPCLATQCITYDELEEIQRYVENNAVEPYHTCPTPSNSSHACKFPVCIHSYQCCNLYIHSFIKFKVICTLLYYYTNKHKTRLTNNIINQQLTNCAMRKAIISKRPGRSRKDQLLDRVTKINA